MSRQRDPVAPGFADGEVRDDEIDQDGPDRDADIDAVLREHEEAVSRVRELQAHLRAVGEQLTDALGDYGLVLERVRTRTRGFLSELSTREEAGRNAAAELARRADALADRERELDTERERNDRRAAELTDRERVVAELAERASVRERELVGRQDELDGRERDLVDRERAAGERAERASARERELTARQEELDGRERELLVTRERVEGEERRLAERNDELDRRERELADRERGAGERAERASARERELAARQEELDGRERELAARQEELDGRERELLVTRERVEGEERRLAERDDELDRRERELAERERAAGERASARERELAVRQEELDGRERELAERARRQSEAEADLARRRDDVDAEIRRRSEQLEHDASRLEATWRGLEDAALARVEALLADRVAALEERERALAGPPQLPEGDREPKADPVIPPPADLDSAAVSPVPEIWAAVAASASPGDAVAAEEGESRRRARNLDFLAGLVDEAAERFPDRVIEWRAYLLHLREFATPEGRVPESFDDLISDVFGPLFPRRDRDA